MSADFGNPADDAATRALQVGDVTPGLDVIVVDPTHRQEIGATPYLMKLRVLSGSQILTPANLALLVAEFQQYPGYSEVVKLVENGMVVQGEFTNDEYWVTWRPPESLRGQVGIRALAQDSNGDMGGDQITVDLAPAILDLELASWDIAFSTNRVATNEWVIIATHVRNSGTRLLTNIPVRFAANDEPIGADQTIASLPAGASTPVSVSARFDRSGTRLIRAIVDPDSTIPELNENNNAAQRYLFVGDQRGPYGGISWPVPGRIEAEDFDTGGMQEAYYDTSSDAYNGQYRTNEYVDIETRGGSSQGYAVDMYQTEWLEYTIEVATSAVYDVALRFQNRLPYPGVARLYVDGNEVTGSGGLSLACPGANDIWMTGVIQGVPLTQGEHVLRVKMMEASGVFLDYLELGAPGSFEPEPKGPHPGQHRAPGRIEAEDFDTGGPAVSYHETTAGNAGGAYRTNDHVDIYERGGSSQGYAVDMYQTEWMEYTIEVATGAVYDVALRFQNIIGYPGVARLYVDGNEVTGSGGLSLACPGANDIWMTGVIQGVPLTQGEHVLRVKMMEASGVFLDYLELGAPGSFEPEPKGPHPGQHRAPGRIEAEDFDTGGPAVSYHETTAGNAGGAYRTNDHADIYERGGSSQGYAVDMYQTEWLEYTIDVATGAVYDVALRFQNIIGSPGVARLYVDGIEVTGSGGLSLAYPGANTIWMTGVIQGVPLTQGEHVLRVKMMEASGVFLDYLELGAPGSFEPNWSVDIIAPLQHEEVARGSLCHAADGETRRSNHSSQQHSISDRMVPSVAWLQHADPIG